ncbi:U4/U6 small nuclear ribonucleoprotein PRP3 [Trypanosoma grayi]|uniref:U4/U6 small nuclear ribonucleoprotein PRP3 n=1 Tax=Trypanosoma grayi TaxID=71804 RepID=UPI0004F44D2D|nr:U4/U6 small nuclear ribonucleoprotein PRP3 [Trypanosoma grayi]KEG10224.1 U4/U6 small nuclear ribonucleoprotein PRP3 [Trypanosoma grayi]
MPPKKTQRHPISIDDDEAIDFSAVVKTSTAGPAVPPVLLQAATADAAQQQQQEAAPALQAVDPRLNAYVHRAAPRRRIAFGGPSPASAPAAPAESAAKTAPSIDSNSSSGSKALLDALWREEAARQEGESQRSRRESYEQQLEAHWRGGSTSGAAATGENAAAPHQIYSFLDQFFEDGVPDVEPWDMWALSLPRYGAANIAAPVLDRVHHPVLQETHYSQHYLHRAEERPVEVKVAKGRDELRAERRERLRKEKEERDRAKRAAQQQGLLQDGGTLTTTGAGAKDRLTNSNLRFNLFGDSVLNPLSTENKVYSQYQERFLEHQRRNHERHVAAIPQQIEKCKRDRIRHAEERPVIRAYRIYPIYSPAHLGKLRNFANDGLLRGFVLWVGGCDALVVLTGGEVALRHVERWVLEKMRWESPETTAVRLMTCPLHDAATFSFASSKSRKRRRLPTSTAAREAEEAEKGENEGAEHVYMNFVDSVQEGVDFLRTVPTEGPWRDLTHVWRAALAAGVGRGA